MKLFNNLQELWEYLAHCPMCNRSDCRKVSLQGNSFQGFSVIEEEKTNNILNLQTSLDFDNKLVKINFVIDCLNNSYTFSHNTSDPAIVKEINRFFASAQVKHGLYFTIYSDSVCNQNDIIYYTDTDEIFLENSRVVMPANTHDTIEIDQQGFTYSIAINSKTNKMCIGKIVFPTASTGTSFAYSQEMPIINFDFSDKEKLVTKIKTLLTFV